MVTNGTHFNAQFSNISSGYRNEAAVWSGLNALNSSRFAEIMFQKKSFYQ